MTRRPVWLKRWLKGKNPLSVRPSQSFNCDPAEVCIAEKDGVWTIGWPDNAAAVRELEDYRDHRDLYIGTAA